MPSSGPNSPGSTGFDVSVGTVAWTDPGNITASDDSYATAVLNNQISNYLVATNFGFAIPSGAVIDGIVVSVERSQTGSGAIYDFDAALYFDEVIDGTPGTAPATQWPSSDAAGTYGASNDAWGLSLTGADVNETTFGFVLSAQELDTVEATARVDHVTMTVYYTEVVGLLVTKPQQRRVSALRRM